MKPARRVAFVTIALLVPLAVAELVVRIGFSDGLASPEAQRVATQRMLERVDRDGLRFRGRADATFELAGVDYRHDALGLRNAPLATPKPADVVRVLCLGDSTTYGLGVVEPDTWPRRLESMLNEHAPRGRTIEVVNAGVSAFNTADAHALFRALADEVQPDVVLLGWYGNDLERFGFFLQDDGTLAPDPLPTPELLKPWLLHSALYRRLSASRLRSMVADGSYVLGVGDNLRVPGEHLLALAEDLAARRIRLAIVEIPFLEGSDPDPLVLSASNYKFRAFSDWLDRTAAAAHVPLLHLVDSLEGQSPPLLWVSLHDHHPNATACQRFAAAIAAFVTDRGLLAGT